MNIWKYHTVQAKSIVKQYNEEILVNKCCELEKHLMIHRDFLDKLDTMKLNWNYDLDHTYSYGFSHLDYAMNLIALLKIKGELEK